MKYRIHIPALLALAGTLCIHAAESPLESDFKNPPVETRPYVWWHWMGSNFSKEGITPSRSDMLACKLPSDSPVI